MTASLPRTLSEAVYVELIMLQIELCYAKPVKYCQSEVKVTKGPGDDDYEVVDTYEGEETTIYYDAEEEQHVVVNGNG